MSEIEHQGTVAMTGTHPISRELLGKIVDEVFDGAIEDASVIEEIYAAIKKHETPPPQDHVLPTFTADVLPIELDGVADRLSEGDGFWRSCSGCHELNEGVPTGPYSDLMKCHLGMGCRECGGIGSVWDGTDYSTFGVEPEPVDLAELPDDVRQAAIIAFNTAADVPHWGSGEPYLIIGRAIMAGRTSPAEIPLADVFAVHDGGNSITLHFAEIKSAKAFRDSFAATIVSPAPTPKAIPQHPIGYISRQTFAELVHDNSGSFEIVTPHDLMSDDLVPIFSLPGAHPSDLPPTLDRLPAEVNSHAPSAEVFEPTLRVPAVDQREGQSNTSCDAEIFVKCRIFPEAAPPIEDAEVSS